MAKSDDKKRALEEIDILIDGTKAKYVKDFEELNSLYDEAFKACENSTKDLIELQKKYYEDAEKLTEKENSNLKMLYEQKVAIEKGALEEIQKYYSQHNTERRKKLEDSLKTEEELLDEHYETNRKLLEGNEKALRRLEEKYNKDKEELTKKHLEEEKRLKEQTSQNFIGGFNLFTSGINQIVNVLKKAEQDILNSYGKADQEAVNYGRAIGMTSEKVDELRGNVAKFMVDNNMAIKYNLRTDEMIKLAGDYSREIGRAVSLTHDQMENMAQLNLLMGSDKAVKFTASFDKFGLSVESAALIAEDMFNDANKKGLSFEQISENFLNNIELAQQYTFENGIEGLKRMAENASAVKWNLQQTAVFAEKVNNIEGAIKTGAQLSVLGGPFAQFSNPMGMLYESLNDMEGLQDRVLSMFGNLAFWNDKKGVVDVSSFDKQRIRAASSAMGLNYGDVMNTIHQQGRRKKILENIKNLGFDKDTQELIANTAQLDEKGEAYVTIDGQKKYVKDGLEKRDKENLIAKSKSDSENLKDIAANSKSILEVQESIEKNRLNVLTNFYEGTNIGKKIEDIYNVIAEMQKYVVIIQGITMAIQMLMGLKDLYSGAKQMFGARGGSGLGVRGTARGSVGGSGMRGSITGTRYQVYRGERGTMIGRDGRTSAQRYNNMYGGTWNRTRAMGRNIKSNLKAAAPSLGVGALAVGGMTVGGLMSAQSDRLRARGNHGDAAKVNLAGEMLSGAMSGAAMGAFGGPIGASIGAIVGAIGGAAMSLFQNNEYEKEEKRRKEAEWAEKEVAKREEKRQERVNELKEEFYKRSRGLELKGNYSEEFIRYLFNGKDMLSHTHRNTLEAGGDIDVWNNLPAHSFAAGGILKGSSHAEGGMNVVDNKTGSLVAEIEGDEGIIPKNIMKKFGTVGNLINKAMRPLQPMGEIMSVDANNNTYLNSSLNVGGSANVNVGGSIQLSMPNGQNYNIVEDPAAMRMIGDNVMRHIMSANQQIFNKSEFYRKW